MPELPEVETMRRGIIPTVGCTVAEVTKLPCPRKPIEVSPRLDRFRRRAVGQRIVGTDRIGKRVLMSLANGESIVFEPRMTGLVLLSDPPTREHLRFELKLTGDGPQRLWYWDRRGLGNVRLLSPSEVTQRLRNTLGPDALAVTADALRNRLRSSRRAVKVALLDQAVVAGIGNLYAAEILHVAGVSPRRGCHRLSGKQWTRIAAATVEVLEAAIHYEGSTLGDGTYRNALNQTGGYQNHHRVYARAGEVCPTCQAAKVRRIVQAQRATFYCPQCQR